MAPGTGIGWHHEGIVIDNEMMEDRSVSLFLRQNKALSDSIQSCVYMVIFWGHG